MSKLFKRLSISKETEASQSKTSESKAIYKTVKIGNLNAAAEWKSLKDGATNSSGCNTLYKNINIKNKAKEYLWIIVISVEKA